MNIFTLQTLDAHFFTPINTFIDTVSDSNETFLRIIKDSIITAVDEPTFAKLNQCDFKDGIIEIKILSRLLEDAPDFSRGFIGLAFRINEDNTKFEGIYIRPTNGRNESQLRRNCSTQYFSYPDYKYDRLRIETPGKYESYADMGLNEWIDMKVEVIGSEAKLYLNHSQHPVLVINDLKHGSDATGSIGLWVDIGTEGFFKDLKISMF